MPLRKPHSSRAADAGFTLIELIVVMVIIGILAAVALPVYQNQQRQAADTATKSDLTTISRTIAGIFVEEPGASLTVGQVIQLQGGKKVVNVVIAGGRNARESVTLSTNVELYLGNMGRNAYNFVDQYNWCVALNNPEGKLKVLHYQAGAGISAGGC